MGSHDGSVHHQPLVGVDTDAEETRVGVNLENLVAGSQVVEDTSLVQDGQVGHVFLLLELGGIALENFGLGKAGALLGRRRRKGDDISMLTFKETPCKDGPCKESSTKQLLR